MLVYENNHPGTVQAYTDKSTLRHEGLPKEGGKASTHPLSGSSTATERGTAPPGPLPQRETPASPGLRLPELGAGLGVPGRYLHTHLGFRRSKQKVSSKSAGKFNAGREGTWPQHPLPVALQARPPPRPRQGNERGKVTSPAPRTWCCSVGCSGQRRAAAVPPVPLPAFPGARVPAQNGGRARGGAGAARSEEQGERRVCTS